MQRLMFSYLSPNNHHAGIIGQVVEIGFSRLELILVTGALISLCPPIAGSLGHILCF